MVLGVLYKAKAVGADSIWNLDEIQRCRYLKTSQIWRSVRNITIDVLSLYLIILKTLPRPVCLVTSWDSVSSDNKVFMPSQVLTEAMRIYNLCVPLDEFTHSSQSRPINIEQKWSSAQPILSASAAS